MTITIQVKPAGEAQYGPGLQNNSLTDGRKSVFAGNLAKNEETAGVIEQKKNQAKKQAMKLVSDAWENDKKSLQGIDDMLAEKEEKKAEITEYHARLKDIAEQNEALQQMPETEASAEALAQNAEEALQISRMAQEAEQQVIGLTQSVTSTRIDRLKSQEMLKAQDAAEEIKEAADEEAVSLLFKDGIEHVKEELEEKLEQAEEAKEKKEEKQEKLDKIREERKEQEEYLEQNRETEPEEVSAKQDSGTMMEEAQKAIQKILTENHLVEEDLKGIEIDLNY